MGIEQYLVKIPKAIFMEVDLQNKELPTGRMADSPSELAQICGLAPRSVSSAIDKARRRGRPCKYVKVIIDDEEDT